MMIEHKFFVNNQLREEAAECHALVLCRRHTQIALTHHPMVSPVSHSIRRVILVTAIRAISAYMQTL